MDWDSNLQEEYIDYYREQKGMYKAKKIKYKHHAKFKEWVTPRERIIRSLVEKDRQNERKNNR